ncbi:hypothetical protein QAD02_021140 [Eretmocerus hayati]|uniref:Uncharacterized protein n=1 Tax=Eretmocerus hayati TaxID=131215 RepID=A0ACC2PSK8_9HYME|nr:hypothetical protein QAD02_021140 [Eretmocerus hayati]
MKNGMSWEKRGEERDAEQDRVEGRSSKIESIIKEKGENMEIVNMPEREKEREDTINELTWRLEDTEKRARRNNIIIYGITWQGENIREKNTRMDKGETRDRGSDHKMLEN